jgi:hypothetical protein
VVVDLPGDVRNSLAVSRLRKGIPENSSGKVNISI